MCTQWKGCKCIPLHEDFEFPEKDRTHSQDIKYLGAKEQEPGNLLLKEMKSKIKAASVTAEQCVR